MVRADAGLRAHIRSRASQWWNFPIRWLPGSAIDPSQPVVTELAGCAARIMKVPPPVVGIEGTVRSVCLSRVRHSGRAVGVRGGGNTHGADEYVELDSVVVGGQSSAAVSCANGVEWPLTCDAFAR